MERAKVSAVMMSVALATGLYASHTFVRPTPGPIAAAGNLDLSDNLGLVIMVGIVVSAVAIVTGYLWAQFAGTRWTSGKDGDQFDHEAYDSYFRVVTQFSKMEVATGYKAQTVATLLLGLTAMAVVAVLSWIVL